MPRLNDTTRNFPLSAASRDVIRKIAAQVLREIFDGTQVFHAAHHWRDIEAEIEQMDDISRQFDRETVQGLVEICTALGISPPKDAVEYQHSPGIPSFSSEMMNPSSADMAERLSTSHVPNRLLPTPICGQAPHQEPPIPAQILTTLRSLDAHGSRMPGTLTLDQTAAMIQKIDQEMLRLDAQDQHDAQVLDDADTECRFVAHLHRETDTVAAALAEREQALRLACRAIGLDGWFTTELKTAQGSMPDSGTMYRRYLTHLADWPEGRAP